MGLRPVIDMARSNTNTITIVMHEAPIAGFKNGELSHAAIGGIELA